MHNSNTPQCKSCWAGPFWPPPSPPSSFSLSPAWSTLSSPHHSSRPCLPSNPCRLHTRGHGTVCLTLRLVRYCNGCSLVCRDCFKIQHQKEIINKFNCLQISIKPVFLIVWYTLFRITSQSCWSDLLFPLSWWPLNQLSCSYSFHRTETGKMYQLWVNLRPKHK